MTDLDTLRASFYRLYFERYGCPDMASKWAADSINLYLDTLEAPNAHHSR